jgi:hypothetical protein
MFSSQTVARLHAVLTGFVPAATSCLIVSQLFSVGRQVGAATLVLMGLVVGGTLGIPLGLWLDRRGLAQADYRLPILLGLLSLPLALLPLQPLAMAQVGLASQGWASVLVSAAAALPLGLCLGTSWAVWNSAAGLHRRGRYWWGGVGLLLGVGLALGTALPLSLFKGAALVALFAAPLLWPTLPRSGDRSLLARMLLTLGVVQSTMILLFSGD